MRIRRGLCLGCSYAATEHARRASPGRPPVKTPSVCPTVPSGWKRWAGHLGVALTLAGEEGPEEEPR